VTLRRSLVLWYARRLGRFASLQKLGAIHGTDKAEHTFGGQSYLAVYER